MPVESSRLVEELHKLVVSPVAIPILKLPAIACIIVSKCSERADLVLSRARIFCVYIPRSLGHSLAIMHACTSSLIQCYLMGSRTPKTEQ